MLGYQTKSLIFEVVEAGDVGVRDLVLPWWLGVIKLRVDQRNGKQYIVKVFANPRKHVD